MTGKSAAGSHSHYEILICSERRWLVYVCLLESTTGLPPTQKVCLMGLDANGARFLLHARSMGVSFDKTLMIGRQDLHLSRESRVNLIHEYRAHFVPGADAILQKSTSEYAEDFISCLGATTVDSMDNSSFEGAAICHDLNEPIPADLAAKYDVVLDGGTLEHVFNVREAFRNCMQMVSVGGHYLGISPANNFMGHGFYQFSPELFFELFSAANGFEVQQVILFEHRRNAPWYEVIAPKTVRSRVSVKNSERTYVLVIAKRIAVVDIFATSPQQSDYEAAWHGEGDTAPMRSKRSEGVVANVVENLKRLGCTLFRRTYFEPLYFKRIR